MVVSRDPAAASAVGKSDTGEGSSGTHPSIENKLLSSLSNIGTPSTIGKWFLQASLMQKNCWSDLLRVDLQMGQRSICCISLDILISES